MEQAFEAEADRRNKKVGQLKNKKKSKIGKIRARLDKTLNYSKFYDFWMNIVQHNNDSVDIICPIPLDQQPIREYRRLQTRMFFRWAILSRSKYVTKLLAVWITALLLILFVMALRSPERALNLSDVLIGAVVAELAVGLVLTSLYAAWRHIYLRLIHREIDYISLVTNKTYSWQKPELFLARDVLVARFQVSPILRQIERSVVLLTIIISFNFSILFLITNY